MAQLLMAILGVRRLYKLQVKLGVPRNLARIAFNVGLLY